ncbi:transposase family protein [Arthrobacter silviterrae]|uniref:Transposase family protein n=1 Tax=Arthrobacter silviterrae TaxID=2026658 RepID=A0ABX0D5N9_9MICC|nr:transposase family protein [Arthrobacter silviterrae]
MPSSHLAVFIDDFPPAGPVEIDPGRVLVRLSGLPDPRKRRGVRHRFAHLLVIMVCSVLAGRHRWWRCPNGRPTRPGTSSPPWALVPRTQLRWPGCVSILDADALDRLARAWAQSLAPVAAIAIDGRKSGERRTAAARGSTCWPASTTPPGPSSYRRTCPRSTTRSPTSSHSWRG